MSELPDQISEESLNPPPCDEFARNFTRPSLKPGQAIPAMSGNRDSAIYALCRAGSGGHASLDTLTDAPAQTPALSAVSNRRHDTALKETPCRLKGTAPEIALLSSTRSLAWPYAPSLLRSFAPSLLRSFAPRFSLKNLIRYKIIGLIHCGAPAPFVYALGPGPILQYDGSAYGAIPLRRPEILGRLNRMRQSARKSPDRDSFAIPVVKSDMSRRLSA